MTPQHDDERWVWVPGYEGVYAVSDAGRVLSMPRPRARGGILKSPKGSGGYPTVALVMHGIQKPFRVHTLVLTAFVGPCPDGFVACHYDGDPSNNRLDNLRWASVKDNAADLKRHVAEGIRSEPTCWSNWERFQRNADGTWKIGDAG